MTQVKENHGDLEAAVRKVIEMLVENTRPQVLLGLTEEHSSSEILKEWDKLRGNDWFGK